MSGSTRSVLLTVLYVLNVSVVACVLAAAYYVSQGLFGDLYACNERAVGEVDHIYQVVEESQFGMQLCLVDLNYTTGPASDGDPQIFFALQVTIPCERIVADTNGTIVDAAKSEDADMTTDLCYNRYRPEFFASVDYGGVLPAAAYSHEDAVRDLHFGFKAVLWTALLGFIASWLHTNLDATETRLIVVQERSLQAWKHARAQVAAARQRLRYPESGGQQSEAVDVRESEMQRVSGVERV